MFYRVGAEAFKRRGGTGLLRSELRLQREFRRRGFTSPAEYVRNVLVRGGYRLIPWWCAAPMYRPLVAASQLRSPGAPGEPERPGPGAAGLRSYPRSGSTRRCPPPGSGASSRPVGS